MSTESLLNQAIKKRLIRECFKGHHLDKDWVAQEYFYWFMAHHFGFSPEQVEKIDYDRIIESVKSLPKQSKIVLYSTIDLVENSQEEIQTGDIYNIYEKTCKDCGLTALTQRRVSDLISELDMLGIINARVVSLGRYGRTRQIKLSIYKRY